MIQVNHRDELDRRWFLILLFFLIVDLGRPQEILPIGSLRLGLVATVLLASHLCFTKHRSSPMIVQSRLIIYFTLLLACYIPIANNNYLAYLAFKTMCLMLPFLLSSIILLNSRSRLLIVCSMYGVLVILTSIYSLFHGGIGPGGILGDENDMCLFLVSFLPIILFLLGQEKKKINKLFWLLGVFIVSIAIVVTQSRGGFVGFLGMIVVYWVFSKKKILMFFGISCIAFVMLIVGGETYKKDMATISDITENTANIRLLSWQAGWDMFLDNPQGVGGNNFPVRFAEYQPEEFQRGMWGRVAHSLWFTLIPETGVLGIFLYFMIIKVNLRDLKYLYQSKKGADFEFYRPLAIALYACFAGFFAAGSFISVLYYPYFWYLSVLVASTRKIALIDMELVDASR